MKRLLTLILFLLVSVFLFAQSALAVPEVRAFSNLTAATTGSLRKFSVDDLEDDDLAFGIVADVFMVFQYHDGDTSADDAKTRIRPDDYATDGVWWLCGKTAAGAIDFSSATTMEIINSTSDLTLSAGGQIGINLGDDQIAIHFGSAGEIQGEAAISGLDHFIMLIDPAWAYDQEDNYHIVPIATLADDYIEGFTMTEWQVSFVSATRTTALDMDLICDTTPDYNPTTAGTVMDVMDIAAAAQSSTADSGFDSASCANGAKMYLRFGSDPVDANELLHVEIWGYKEED